jgi:hypothetical protein
MASFNSNEEAQLAIEETIGRIDQILNEDLYPVEETERTLELWIETFGKMPDYLEKKERLLSFEMALTDAEIYILHYKSLHENLAFSTSED